MTTEQPDPAWINDVRLVVAQLQEQITGGVDDDGRRDGAMWCLQAIPLLHSPNRPLPAVLSGPRRGMAAI
jgi:hypothetical protein